MVSMLVILPSRLNILAFWIHLAKINRFFLFLFFTIIAERMELFRQVLKFLRHSIKFFDVFIYPRSQNLNLIQSFTGKNRV